MVSSMNATSSSLRWRSRFTKEAINGLDDDSSFLNNDRNSKLNNKPAASVFMIPTTVRARLLLYATATLAVCCSIATLFVTHMWFMAVQATFGVFTAVLCVVQTLHLRRAASIRQVYSNTRKQLYHLSLQNERFYRHVLQLDQSYDRFHQVQGELQRMIGTRDATVLIPLIQQLSRTNQQMSQVIRYQAQEVIIKSLLSTPPVNQRYTFSKQAVDQLMQQLKSIPGIHWNESVLRHCLFGGDDDTSLTAVLRVLRRVSLDEASMASSIFTCNLNDIVLAKKEKEEEASSTKELYEC